VIETTAFVVVTLTLPLLLAAAVTVDLALGVVKRKPWMGVRLVAMLWWFLFGELRGIAGLTLIGLASLGRDTRTRRFRVYRLRQLWAGGHLDGVRRLFNLTFDVRGLDVVAPGPVLIFMRHASIIDNTMPDSVVGRTHGLGLRFVLKRELEMIPTIDIGGRWVPTNFVRRGSGDTVSELQDLAKLGIDLDPHEGILIYPEGTRSTPAKLAAAKVKIAERQPHIAPLASKLQHLLPPRLGGPLALLEHARDRRGLLRPRRPRRLRADLRHLARRPGRRHGARPVLALPRRRGADRPRRPDHLAVRALAGGRRLGRRAPRSVVLVVEQGARRAGGGVGQRAAEEDRDRDQDEAGGGTNG
jgi:1-acyl-sn-glycerol-3-phosphate acyltransferase